MNFPAKVGIAKSVTDILKLKVSVDYIECCLDWFNLDIIKELGNEVKPLILTFGNYFDHWKHGVYTPERYNKTNILEALLPFVKAINVDVKNILAAKSIISKIKKEDKSLVVSTSFSQEEIPTLEALWDAERKATKAEADVLHVSYYGVNNWESEEHKLPIALTDLSTGDYRQVGDYFTLKYIFL